MKKILFALLMLVSAFVTPPAAQAQTPQETLRQYVTKLQQNPNDTALRERIIQHVRAMKPQPAIPPEAEKFEGRAEFAVRSAKNEADFLDAAREYEKALLIAPWVSAYYFNLGIAFEKGGTLTEAKRSFEFYLLSAPDAPDARDVRKRIAGLEYAIERAAKESSPEVLAAKQQNNYELWLGKLDGAKYSGQSYFGQDLRWENELVIRGSILTWRQRIVYAAPNVVLEVPVGQWYDMAQYGGRMQIIERKAERRLPGLPFVNDVFTISEDGNSITQVVQTTNGGTFTFYRQ